MVIHGRKYFAFSKYAGEGENVTSYCDMTMPGWTNDVLGYDWACYVGHKNVDGAHFVGAKRTPQHTYPR